MKRTGAIDLSKVQEKYKVMWVTFTQKYKVISANENAEKVYQQAKKKGYNHPLLFHMPVENLPFVG